MGVINLAETYSKNIDKAFAHKSYTKVGAKAKFSFIGYKTVKVYSIDPMKMNDYNRNGMNRFGNVEDISDKVQEMTVTKDRSFTGGIDKGNNTQQMKIKKAGELLRDQINEVLNPEMDTYNLAVWTDKAALNGAAFIQTLTKDNVYEYFLEGQKRLSNNRVPTNGRICFATTKAVNLLKRCPEYSKNTETAQKMVMYGQVGKVDNVALIEMPEIYFPAGVQMVIIHPLCSVAPIQLETYRILTEVQGYDGAIIEGRCIYDCFVLDKKKDGIAVISEATLKMNATSEEGKASNGTFLKYELPGITSADGVTVKYKLGASAITAPTAGTTVTGYTAYTDSEIDASTNTHYCLVALKDNKVVFAEAGELVKKA